ncbi:hypothetical protein D3C73_1275870 [compost metagenome]
MVEEQVQANVIAVDGDAHLPADEGKPHVQFQQEGLHVADDGHLQVAFRAGIAQCRSAGLTPRFVQIPFRHHDSSSISLMKRAIMK